MRSTIESAEADNTQRKYARLTGFLFLAEIILAPGSGFVLSHVAGSGTFAETARRIAVSERLYRAALSIVVIVSLSSAMLAFALYATLQAVNRLLAQLGMIFCLGDSFWHWWYGSAALFGGISTSPHKTSESGRPTPKHCWPDAQYWEHN